MVALLCFLALNGHLYLLHALAATFAHIPPGGLLLRPMLTADIITLSANMFVLAVKVAAPVLASLFMIDLALALMARAAPQMNLLMIGMPLKIAVGFFFMSLIFTILAHQMSDAIVSLHPMFRHMLRLGMPGAP
jgi:flagellar biosynthetic protein FliR